MIRYQVGWPGWKFAARMRVPLLVRVRVHFDAESKSYWADSPDLDGLVVAGQDLDELRSEVFAAADELLNLAIRSPRVRATTELLILDELHCVA